MNITIYHQENQNTFQVHVEETTTIDVLKLKISAQENMNYNLIKIFHNGGLVTNSNVTMKDLSIVNDDLVTMSCPVQKQQQNYQNLFDPLAQAKQLISKYLNDEQQLIQLLERDEELGGAIMSEDVNTVQQILNNRNKAMNMGNQFNEMDPNYQRKLEEAINNQRLNQLQQETYENYPELFVPTDMLYIAGKINHVDIDIFVDTGAQTTIISQDFAEKANLMPLVDTRYSTTVMGVGTQKSVGRIWQLQLQIKDRFFVLSATVLKNFSNDMLLGLDMMKRHHCVLDLSKHVIVFGSEGVYTNFFNENEVIKMRMKGQEKNLERIKEVLNVNEEQAKDLFIRYGYSADVVIENEMKKRNN